MMVRTEGEPYAGPGMFRGPPVRPMGACPKCGASQLFEEWGDTVCLVCGWRKVAGTPDLAALEEMVEALEGESPRRRRLPSHGKVKL